jgi:hypothetical protein
MIGENTALMANEIALSARAAHAEDVIVEAARVIEYDRGPLWPWARAPNRCYGVIIALPRRAR